MIICLAKNGCGVKGSGSFVFVWVDAPVGGGGGGGGDDDDDDDDNYDNAPHKHRLRAFERIH